MKINLKNIIISFTILLIFSIFNTFIALDKHAPQDAISAHGMVAAAHPLAQAGIEILKQEVMP